MRLKLFTVIFAIATALIFSACSDESDGGGCGLTATARM